MKKIIFLLLFIQLKSFAQNISPDWVTHFEGEEQQYVYDMHTDVTGHILTTGGFSDTLDVNSGPGEYLLVSPSNYNIFITKQDAAGNILWARNIGGGSNDFGEGIATDAAGNVYICGYFNGLVDFDPGPGNFNLLASGGSQAFILKLDANGNFIWAKQIEGTGFSNAVALAVDNAQNVVFSGQFQQNADLDPGPGVSTVLSAGVNDIFLVKLDAAGNFIWGHRTGGIETDFVNEIMLDNAGSTFSVGHYRNSVDFDPGAGMQNFVSVGQNDNFIAKYDGSGNLIWAKTSGGPLSDFAFSFDLDAAGNLIYAASFTGTSDVDPGPGITNFTSVAYAEVFISKLDPLGNLVWARQIEGGGNDAVRSLKLDQSGNVYCMGDFTDSADFDPGPAVETIQSFGGGDIFLLKLDNNGNYLKAIHIGGAGWDESNAVAITLSGEIVLSGTYALQADFDPGAGTLLLDAGNWRNTFTAKYTQNIPLPAEILRFSGIPHQNKIVLNWETAQELNTDHFVVQKSKNAIDWEYVQNVKSKGSGSEIQRYEASDDKPFSGSSYYRLAVYDHDGKVTHSKIIQILFDEQTEISFGPNPVTHSVYFSRSCDLTLSDMNGKQLMKQASARHLNMNQFAPGTYFVLVSPNDQPEPKIIRIVKW